MSDCSSGLHSVFSNRSHLESRHEIFLEFFPEDKNTRARYKILARVILVKVLPNAIGIMVCICRQNRRPDDEFCPDRAHLDIGLRYRCDKCSKIRVWDHCAKNQSDMLPLPAKCNAYEMALRTKSGISQHKRQTSCNSKYWTKTAVH